MVSEKDVKIDLHIHTTASDGSCTPSEIVALVKKHKIGAFSITDHDTVDGVRELIKIGVPEDIGFVTGVEVSASPPNSCASQGSMHILGYGMDIENPDLDQTLRKLQDSRKNRNPKIIQKLNDLGIRITLEEVAEHAGDCQLARPHIGKFLVHKGYVASIDEAFDKYLSKDKPAYAEKFRVSCADAIGMILRAGGVPVLAHPYLVKPAKGYLFQDIVVELISMGLKGIEAYYPEHPPDFERFCLRLADKYSLAVTGGTDFHGDIKPEIEIGSGSGEFAVPFQAFIDLKKLLARGIADEQVAEAYEADVSKLLKTVRYEFRDRHFLEEALRHSSWVNENPEKYMRDNERMEFLGDSVLNLAIAKALMEKNPNLREGDLSRIRACMVNESQLAELARRIRLGTYLHLGKGELLTNGRNKNSILADAFEALIAALFLDGGFEAAENFVRESFGELLENAVFPVTNQDYKSRLQEIAQTGQAAVPDYRIVEESGPDHDKTFHVRVDVLGKSAVGVGKSKKAAEQEAARNLLILMQEQ